MMKKESKAKVKDRDKVKPLLGLSLFLLQTNRLSIEYMIRYEVKTTGIQ
jgi:hypothetical protein